MTFKASQDKKKVHCNLRHQSVASSEYLKLHKKSADFAVNTPHFNDLIDFCFSGQIKFF